MTHHLYRDDYRYVCPEPGFGFCRCFGHPEATKWFPSEDPKGGGGLIQGGGRKPSSDGCVVYFNAGEDLTIVLDRVEPAGGKVLSPENGNPEWGYVAFFLDTEGNRVGLQSPG